MLILVSWVPLLQLVESSVELLKDGLEELVERSAEGYPHLTILCRVPFLKTILILLSCAGFPSCSWLNPLWSC